MKSLRILTVDDHEVVRRGVRALLQLERGWNICGEAATGREAIELAGKLRPDIVLMDITLPDMDGLDAIRHILDGSSVTKVIILTMHDSGAMATRALAAGANAVVLKSDAGHDLILALRAVAKGRAYLSPVVTKTISNHLAKTGEPSPADLSSRELQVIKLLAQGRSHKQVSAALKISAKTVEAHRANLMRKLGLANSSELIQFAIRHKIVHL